MNNKQINNFVINLERSKDRLRKFKQRNSEYIKDLNKIIAVDGLKETYKDYENKYLINVNKKIKNRFMGGNIATMLSHIKAWETIIKLSNFDDINIIFEDDAIILPNFNNNLLNLLLKLPKDFDFLYLYHNSIIDGTIIDNYYKPNINYNQCVNTGFVCYVITKHGAQKLLRLIKPINLNFKNKLKYAPDHFIKQYWNKINVYFTVKNIVTHDFKTHSERGKFL